MSPLRPAAAGCDPRDAAPLEGPAAPEVTAGIFASKAATAPRCGRRAWSGSSLKALQHHPRWSTSRRRSGRSIFPRLQLALDVNLGALLQILFGDLAESFVENHDSVPLGLFPCVLRSPLSRQFFRGRYAQIGDRPAVLGAPDLRILGRDFQPKLPCSRFPAIAALHAGNYLSRHFPAYTPAPATFVAADPIRLPEP